MATLKTLKNREDRVRAIAKEFLREEPALFGISNMNELRERRIDTTTGRDGEYTTVRYSRYIDNLEFNGMYIRIDIGPDERIIGISAEILPASLELYEAVKKKTIIEDEAIKIIKHDLVANGVDTEGLKILMTKKIALSSHPYVVWIANMLVKKGSNWGYTINAFTGKVVKKGELQRFIQ